MITLYGFQLSGNCYKIRLFLSLLGLHYENITIDVKSSENKTPEFLALNPNGLLPVLIDNDVVIYDSAAILTYLAKTNADGVWIPKDNLGLANVVRWLAFEQSEGRYGLARARAKVKQLPSPLAELGSLQESQTIARDALAILEEGLKNSNWLVSNEHPTIADIACYPYTAMCSEGDISLQEFTSIQRWIADIENLPGYIPLPGL